MKKSKKILAALMALLCLGLVMIPAVPAKAATTSTVYINQYTDAKGNTKSFTKGTVTIFSQGSFRVSEEGGNHAIKNLKANKKGIKVAVTYTYYGSRYVSDSEDTIPYRETTISYYATKAGTYKITFKVGTKSYAFNLKAFATSTRTAKVTFGKQVVWDLTCTPNGTSYTYKYRSNTKVSGTKGKLTVKASGAYKNTGMIAVTFTKKGVPTYTKLKNGGTLKLSKGYYKYTSDDKTYTSTSARKYTYVYISYKNTYLGETVTYTIGKHPDTKEKCIVCTTKDPYGTEKYYITGESGYDAAISLWQY